MPTTPAMPVRRARWAVAALFWLNGATLSSMMPRYPEIRDNLDLTNTFFGLAVAMGPAGGLLAGIFTARVMRASTSARVATWAQVMQILLFCCVLNAPHAWLFALALVAMSATDVYTDIAMNAHGMRVQTLYGRSINNSFHAWWSLGAVCGGLLGAWFAGIHLALPWHALVAAAIMLAVNLSLRPFLLKGPDPAVVEEHEPAAAGSRIPRQLMLHLLALGAIGAFAASIEDSGFTWSALYLRDSLHATPAVAGLGIVCLVGAQTVGRFAGDRMVDALGDRNTARLGCTIATVGMGLALAFPSVPLTLLGFACAGWGVATLVPAVYYTAHHLPGLPAGSGLTIVNWMLRLTFFVGPPLVGTLSDHLSFRAALTVMPLATLMIVLLAGFLARRRTEEFAEPVPAQPDLTA
ncbi:MFS transporter [Luteococcus peritonei]|uniref:MFS transporter n=1 Tax=Luteococcus peritonei TaxID=88874 RepID=A0ABW4RUQ1_9ACTN